MTDSARRKLDEATRLLESVNKELGEELQELMRGGDSRKVMFAAVEAGAIAAVIKALEAV